MLNLEALQESRHAFAPGGVDRYGDDFERLRSREAAKPVEQRKLAGAGRTPARPEIDENGLAAKHREIERSAIDCVEADRGSGDHGLDERELFARRFKWGRRVRDGDRRGARRGCADQGAEARQDEAAGGRFHAGRFHAGRLRAGRRARREGRGPRR
jgi:hypothetical protein